MTFAARGCLLDHGGSPAGAGGHYLGQVGVQEARVVGPRALRVVQAASATPNCGRTDGRGLEGRDHRSQVTPTAAFAS